MLNENIKSFRKAKGLSQEELAVKVNVVRQTISQKLEVINLQLAKQKESRRKALHWFFVSVCAILAVIMAILIALNSPYLGWDFSNPETAVAGTAFHAFEWLFIRLAPIILLGAIFGLIFTRSRKDYE